MTAPVTIAQARRQAADLADLIEQLGADIAARYGQAEVEAIEAVVAQVQATILRGRISPAEQLTATRELTALGNRLAVDTAPPTYIRELVAAAAADGSVAVGPGGRTAGEAAVKAVQARVSATMTQQLAVLNAPMQSWAVNIYRRLAAQAVGNLVAGVDTVQEAQQRLMQRTIAAGIPGFRDTAGRSWRVGSYAEMVVRTGAMEAWDGAHTAEMRSAGISLVQIVAGAGACPECSAVSGRIWSTDGTPGGNYLLQSFTTGDMVPVTVAGTLDQARAAGWRHPNCRCTPVAYLPGTQRLTGSTYDAAAEQARDRLRYLERRKRDLKRREAAALDQVERQRARAAIRQTDAAIRDHVNRTGLNRRRYREQLSFSDG